jgi:hypothetical protein
MDDRIIQLQQGLENDIGSTIDEALEGLSWALAEVPLALLNSLLVSKVHHHHQRVTRALQHRRDAGTIPFVRQALEAGFAHLQYTASEDGVIAKWFSWLLSDIGTDGALEMLQKFSKHSNAAVAAEMRYRLTKRRRDS